MGQEKSLDEKKSEVEKFRKAEKISPPQKENGAVNCRQLPVIPRIRMYANVPRTAQGHTNIACLGFAERRGRRVTDKHLSGHRESRVEG